MKKILIIVLFAIAIKTSAQKLEYSVQITSGLSSFRGTGTDNLTFINYTGTNSNYTNNPYGNKQAALYGLSAQIKLVTRHQLLFGLQAGYESIRSRVDLSQLLYTNDSNPSASYSTSSTMVAGHTIFTNNFINLNPFIGYRINAKKFAFDLTPGLDVGIGLNSNEKGKSQSQSSASAPLYINTKRSTPPTDVRLRFDAKVSYYKFGIMAGYARGTTNYLSGMVYQQGVASSQTAYSNLIRLGLTYAIN